MIETKSARPVWHPAGKVGGGEQPFTYPLEHPFVEPDWRRLPGYKDVTAAEWETALWQRRHTVKNLKELQAVFGPLLPQNLLDSMDRFVLDRSTNTRSRRQEAISKHRSSDASYSREAEYAEMLRQ